MEFMEEKAGQVEILTIGNVIADLKKKVATDV